VGESRIRPDPRAWVLRFRWPAGTQTGTLIGHGTRTHLGSLLALLAAACGASTEPTGGASGIDTGGAPGTGTGGASSNRERLWRLYPESGRVLHFFRVSARVHARVSTLCFRLELGERLWIPEADVGW